jgi:hypothetical protein
MDVMRVGETLRRKLSVTLKGESKSRALGGHVYCQPERRAKQRARRRRLTLKQVGQVLVSLLLCTGRID